jgi:hypothetical protein
MYFGPVWPGKHGSAAFPGCDVTAMAPGTVVDRLKRSHFHPWPLVFNGKSRYLNPPEPIPFIHGIFPVAFLQN